MSRTPIYAILAALLSATSALAQPDNVIEMPPMEVYPSSSGPNFLFHPRADRFYGSVNGGVLGLSLPGFNFFQEMDQDLKPIRFFETDDGLEPAGMIGGAIGFCSGQRYAFEARGFYSQRDSGNSSVFVDTPTTRIGFSDIDGTFFSFSNATGVTLSTKTSRDVVFGNFDLIAKYDILVDRLLQVSSYGGYSSFQLDQTLDVSGKFFAPDGTPTGDGVNLTEDLCGTYHGLLVGFELWSALGSYTTLGVDGSLGLYRLEVERDGTENVFGPTLTNRLAVVNQSEHHSAVAARLRVELIQHFGWCDLSLFGALNYLSAVPFVDYGRISPAGVPPSTLATSEAGWYTAGLQMRIPF